MPSSKQFILLVVLCLCFNVVCAQPFRYADIRIQIISPTPETLISSPSVIEFSLSIYNKGPDSIYPLDSLFYLPYHTLNSNRIRRKMIFGKVIKQFDSMIITDTISINSTRANSKFILAIREARAYSGDYGFKPLHVEFYDDRRDNWPLIYLMHAGNLNTPKHKSALPTISLRPNPTKNMIFIEGTEIAEVTLCDMSGRQINLEPNSNLDNTTRIHIKQPEGMYLVHITLHNGSIVTKRIQVIH